MAWKTMVTELLWFLRGDTNIKYLVNNGCHIWDGDSYKNYVTKIQSDYSTYNPKYKDGFDCNYKPVTGTVLEDIGSKYSLYAEPFTMDEFINKIKTDDEFAKKWGELGPIYGAQWRSWKGFDNDSWINTDNMNDSLVGGRGLFYQPEEIDQIQNLINDLKTNPDSRRLMVNAWNVGELDQMVLPPCHFSFQCYSHEKDGKRYLSLAWNQRSIDFGLGLPFNIASYGLLLEIIAKEVGMIPYELIGNLGDCHIYNNHIDGLKEQLTREPYPLPKICLDYREGEYNKDLTDLTSDDFVLFDYQFHPSIKLPLSN
jgi:thymidylate synthase